MKDPARLERTSALLAQRYGEAGRQAAGRLRRWMSGEIPYAEPEIIDRHLEAEHLALVFDAFRQVLPFGTGGRRGPVGYGANRMNPSTVAMTVQGHCNYLNRSASRDSRVKDPSPDRPSVVVANDVRVFTDNGGAYGFLGPRASHAGGVLAPPWPGWRARSTPPTASSPSWPHPKTMAP